jgi:hypothetical protein
MLTNAHKLALRDWLQANVHKAVKTVYWREGVKDENGKPVYGPCIKYKPNSNEAETYLDEEGVEQPVEYWGRTFVLRSRQTFDWQEVVRRVWRKAVKNGYDVTPEQVANFLRQYKDNIKGWANVGVITGGIATPESVIDEEDPDQ